MRKFLLTTALFLIGMAVMQAQSTADWTEGDDISQDLDWGDYDGSTNAGGYWQGTQAAYSDNEWEVFQGDNVDLYQMVYLPAGVYQFRCQGFYRDGGNGEAAANYFAGKSSKNAVLYVETGEEDGEGEFVPAKTFSTPMMSQWATGNKAHLYETTEWTNDASYTYNEVQYWAPNCMAGGRAYFNEGLYDENVVNFYLMEDGYVKLGLRKPGEHLGSDWLLFTNFRIIFQGEASEAVELLEYQKEVQDYYNQIVALENEYEGGLIVALISDAMIDFDTEYGDIESMNKEQCLAALEAIKELYDSVVSLNAAYEKFGKIITMMEVLYNSTDYAGKEAFGQVLDKAKAYTDPDYVREEADDLNTFPNLLSELLAARTAYLLTQEQVDGAYNFSSAINNPFFCNNEYTPTWDAEYGAYKFTDEIESTWVNQIREQSTGEVMTAHADWKNIASDVAWTQEKGVTGTWIYNYHLTSGWATGISNVTMQHGYTAVGSWSENPTGGYIEMRQAITDLPAGYYAMGALFINAGNDPIEGQYVYINSGTEPDDATMEKADFTHKGTHWWNGIDANNVKLWRTDDWQSLRTNMIYVGEDGTVTIGARSNWFFAVTGFQLYYYGETPDFTTLIAPTLNDVKTAAEGLSWAGDKTAVQAILNQIPAEITTPEAYQAALASIAEANNYITTATATINAWKGIDNFSELLDKYEETSPEYAIVEYAFMETLDLGNGANDTYIDAIQNNKDYDAYVSYLGYRASMGALINDPAVAAVVSTQNTYLATNFAHDTELDEFKAALAVPYNKALLASLDAEHASEAKPVDLTALIVNPDFSEGTMGWNGEMTIDTIYCTPERYDCDFDINQTIHALPAGCYQIQVQAFYRDGGDAQTAYDNWFSAAWDVEFWDNPNVLLYANQVGEVVTSLASEEFEDQSMTQYYTEWQKAEEGDAHGDDVYEPKWIYQSDAEAGKENSYPWDAKIDEWGSYYYPQSQYGASMRLNSDPSVYVNKVTFMVEEEGSSVTFGIKNIAYIKNHWCVFDNFKLFYLGTETPTNVEGLNADATAVAEYFSANGVKQNGLQKGFNIVKKNGNVSKIYVK